MTPATPSCGLKPSASPTRRAMLMGGLATASAVFVPELAAQARSTQHSTAAALVAAVNSRDPAGIVEWARSYVSQEGLARLDPVAWSAWLTRIGDESGRWSLDRVERMGATTRLYLRTQRLDGVRRIDVRNDLRDPEHILDLRPVMSPFPYPHRPKPATSVQELASAIRKRFNHAVRSQEFSGVVHVADPDGRPVFEAAHGWADQEAGRAMTAGTPINLGSADKSFTAVLIGQQVEHGRLTFDTLVADVLPDVVQGASLNDLTIRHLLCHAGGLGVPGDGILDYSRDRYARVTDLLPAIVAAPRAFAPGTSRSYSNEGFVMLGAVLERLGNASYWDLLEAGVYLPAGMRNSGQWTRDETKGRVAIGYRHERQDLLLARPRQDNRDMIPWRGNSCGGGYSTTADMTRFLHALRRGDLVSQATLATMTVPSGRPYPTMTYGLGFVLETVGATRLIGHSGGGGMSGIGAAARVAIDTGWSVVALSNYDVPYADGLLSDIAAMLPLGL